jgi:hypothetical protein
MEICVPQFKAYQYTQIWMANELEKGAGTSYYLDLSQE